MDIIHFAGAIYRHWVPVMTGSLLAILFSLFGLWRSWSRRTLFVIWVAFGVVGLGWSGFSAWQDKDLALQRQKQLVQEEKKRAETAENKLDQYIQDTRRSGFELISDFSFWARYEGKADLWTHLVIINQGAPSVARDYTAHVASPAGLDSELRIASTVHRPAYLRDEGYFQRYSIDKKESLDVKTTRASIERGSQAEGWLRFVGMSEHDLATLDANGGTLTLNVWDAFKVGRSVCHAFEPKQVCDPKACAACKEEFYAPGQ